jgi:hypothetical protein
MPGPGGRADPRAAPRPPHPAPRAALPWVGHAGRRTHAICADAHEGVLCKTRLTGAL